MTRHGRRYVGIHLTVSDVRELSRVAPFSWAKYELREEGEQVVFRETLSKPASTAGESLDALKAQMNALQQQLEQLAKKKEG